MMIKNNLNFIKTKKYKKYNYKTKKADVIQYGGDPKTNIMAVITKLCNRNNINIDNENRDLLVDIDNTSIQNLYDFNIVYRLNLLIKKLDTKLLNSIISSEAFSSLFDDDTLQALFIPNTSINISYIEKKISDKTKFYDTDIAYFRDKIKEMINYYNSLNIDTQWKNLKDQFYENYKKLTAEEKKDPDIEETHKYYSDFKDTRGDFTQAKKLAKNKPLYTIGAIGAIGALGYSAAVIRNKSKKTEEEKRKNG